MQPSERTKPVEIVRIIPPVNNTANVDSVQRLIGRLYHVAGHESFSLEIVQQDLETHLLIAAPGHVMPNLLAHVRQTYPQAQIQPLSPDQDPARRRASYECATMAVLRLKERNELALQTTDDFTVADTMQGMMALAGTLESNERTVAQLVLRPAPNPWSGLARVRPDQVRLITANGRMALLSGLVISLFLAGMMVLCASTELMLQHLAGVLWASVAIALGVGSISIAYWLWPKLRPLEAETIAPKVREVGFEFSLRLAAFASTPERAQQLFTALRASYGQFDLAGGNSLQMESRTFDPTRRCIEDGQGPLWMFRVPGILSTTEVACLWHLPLEVTSTMHMGPGLYHRLVPPRALVSGGHLIGRHEYQGRDLKVHLPREAMASHILVLGRSQRGKSALLQRLAAYALSDRSRALIVIDPHADLAHAIAGTANSDQSGRMIYWDLHNAGRPIGFNLLEPSDTRSDDKIISDVVDIMSRLWRESWGARLEDSLRWAARCLLAASRRGKHVYTLLDVNRLLYDAAFRRLILSQLDDTEAMRFFEYQYNDISSQLRDEMIRPVQNKVNRYINNELVRGVFGQPHSGIDLQAVLDLRSVLLISTHKGLIGSDAAGLIGSSILGQLRSFIAEREAQNPGQRTPVTILVDEAQTLAATTFEGILSEVAKYGCNLILATQTLSLLDTFDPALRPIMLSNQSTLISFETSAEDARALVPEFDEAVTVSDLINLPRYTAYAKTFVAGQRTPVFSFSTLPPQPVDHDWAAFMAKTGADLYGRPRSEVEAEWEARESAIQQEIVQMMQTSVRQPLPAGNGRAKDAAGRRSRPGVGAGPNSVE